MTARVDALFQAFCVDHRVWALVARPMARTLIEHAKVLPLLLRLHCALIGSTLNLSVGTVHLETGDHFQVEAVLFESLRVVLNSDIVWFLGGWLIVDSFLKLDIFVLYSGIFSRFWSLRLSTEGR